MKKIICTFMALMALVVAFAQTPNYQGIVYVTPTGAGTHSGDSWANATASIADAQTLAQANNCVVWVSAGIYYGDTTAQNAFTMVDGVNVYGGFAGDEPADYDVSLRDFETNETILDGDSARMVLYQPSTFSDTTMWDGFTIRNGYATEIGGVYLRSRAVVSNCKIHSNTGTGMHIDNSIVSDCKIYSNLGSNSYGVSARHSTVSNCTIHHNVGSGGVYAAYSTISNCQIYNNTGNYGVELSSNTQLVSSTIVRNEGYGVYEGRIENCIIWGNEINGEESNTYYWSENPHCRFSAVGGGAPGEGNISLQNDGILQPYFVNPSLTVGASDTTSNVDWHLLPNSVCINRGNNAAVVDNSDLDGTERIKQDTVDMGCFESSYYNTSLPAAMPIVYVTPHGAGTQTGDSWANATSSIDYAQAMAQISSGVVWVAAGTYFGDTVSASISYYGDTIYQDAFIMRGVNVYGGFAGNEPSDFDLSLRNIEANKTILDGQNKRRVMYQQYDFDTLTVWDGFTICNGKGGFHRMSSGWRSWPGAGIRLKRNGWLRNCVITHNEFIRNATTFSGGTHESGGAGVYMSNGAVLSNCLIVNNSTDYVGGGICGAGSIYNSIIAKNMSQFSGTGVYGGQTYEDTLSLSNCIVWGNGIAGDIIVSYSAIEGGYPGSGNITLADHDLFNPLFVNPSRTAGVSDSTSNTDWHLQNGSMCINRGDNHAVFDATDMQGALRIQRDTVDMGCYESPWLSSPLPDLSYQGIVFVTPTGSGTKTGESWSNAASSISFATVMAQMNDADVWVAGGTYYGDTTSSNAFTAVAGVNVYGGLAGDEAIDFDLSQRDIEAHATTLDGQNRRRVLYGFELENSMWDGFTITHGRADNSGGGGVYFMNGSLQHCTISHNYAKNVGGVYMDGGTLQYCTITDNFANNGYGGGVYMQDGSLLLHCTITHNYANDGGGVYMTQNNNLENCNHVENCLIANNSCANRGGGVVANYSTTITNSTISNNSCGGYGGGISVCGGPVTITNCLITGNVYDDEFYRNTVPDNIHECSNHNLTVSYSAIENGFSGTHNIPLIEGTLLQPLFVNPSASAGINDETPNVNWHLQEGSICINRGNNAAVTDDVDLSGEERNQRDTVDVGCYESNFYRSHVNINEEYISACDSCVWNDSVYYNEGLYTHTSNGINGYANVGVLHLTVNQSSSAEITVEANQNYNWHENTYTESGDYTWTGQNAAGCDSVVTLHLTITAGITDNGLSSGFTLYPNPTTGLVTIRLSPETCNLTPEIHLFDIYGRRLQMVTVTDGTTQIDLSQYATGIYLVKLVNGGKVVAVRKVVKR